MGLVLPRRRRRVARGDRLHRRLRRGRDADGGAVAIGIYRHRRRRPDVRHHARAWQHRPVAAGQHWARERGRDEDDGRRRPAGRRWPRRSNRLRDRGGPRQLPFDLGAAHPADHRDAVGEFHHPVGRHLLWTGLADQAAAGLRRLHQYNYCWRAPPRDPDGSLHDRRQYRAPPHDLGAIGGRDRPEPARRAAGGAQGRAGALRDLRARAGRSAGSTERCSPAISAAPMSTSARNICSPRSLSW